MAAKNLHENFKLIQDTISNPDFRSKLTHILEEMSGSELAEICLLYTSPSPRDAIPSRMPSSA